MIIIPLQFDSHRGPDSIGQHKLTFTIDESVTTEFNPMTIKKGEQFLVMMIPTDGVELEQFQSESNEETQVRFRKTIEATIREIATELGKDREVFRKEVKEKLKQEGLIKESTKELSLEGLGKVIVRLKDYKYELQNRPK